VESLLVEQIKMPTGSGLFAESEITKNSPQFYFLGEVDKK